MAEQRDIAEHLRWLASSRPEIAPALTQAAETIEELRKDFAIAEQHIERGNDETMKAYRQVRTLTAELIETRRERDQAIAHDRQPYPTAWAYEQAKRGRSASLSPSRRGGSS